jgi:hypothetical protein
MATETVTPRTTRKAAAEREQTLTYLTVNITVARRELMNAAKRVDALGEVEAHRCLMAAVAALDDAKTAAGL